MEKHWHGVIRDADSADFHQTLALNEESVHFLSPLDLARLTMLHHAASYSRVLESEGFVQAFLLALRPGAPYDSPNYRWFSATHADFLYIDRIVVSASMQGRGAGLRLYDDLFQFARSSAIKLITCEVDVEPPNPASERLHSRLGFREVGTQCVGPNKKRVSLQALTLQE
jgi:uncharacterized protein